MKPKRTLSRLSRREREIMDVLFQMGRASAAEVHERIPSPPSYSAVRATMRILEEKGLLKHDYDGKRYIYRPALGQSQARKTAVDHLLDTFFAGSAAGAVMALLENPGQEISEDELDRMAALIDRARKEGR
ncbi:MAG TPA: BlaI/MecI/CopY family transcriptional regulator [Candidatus Krumholzibacteria bacterium]|nr:BlaI/MecI/CopY family transcriptional regulator [Candidatus Krumholzibacteria bacterium]